MKGRRNTDFSSPNTPAHHANSQISQAQWSPRLLNDKDQNSGSKMFTNNFLLNSKKDLIQLTSGSQEIQKSKIALINPPIESVKHSGSKETNNSNISKN